MMADVSLGEAVAEVAVVAPRRRNHENGTYSIAYTFTITGILHYSGIGVSL
jgi:phosphoribosylaminoimidazole carboxylase (NCAIR synthetase)